MAHDIKTDEKGCLEKEAHIDVDRFQISPEDELAIERLVQKIRESKALYQMSAISSALN